MRTTEIRSGCPEQIHNKILLALSHKIKLGHHKVIKTEENDKNKYNRMFKPNKTGNNKTNNEWKNISITIDLHNSKNAFESIFFKKFRWFCIRMTLWTIVVIRALLESKQKIP